MKYKLLLPLAMVAYGMSVAVLGILIASLLRVPMGEPAETALSWLRSFRLGYSLAMLASFVLAVILYHPMMVCLTRVWPARRK